MIIVLYFIFLKQISIVVSFLVQSLKLKSGLSIHRVDFFYGSSSNTVLYITLLESRILIEAITVYCTYLLFRTRARWFSGCFSASGFVAMKPTFKRLFPKISYYLLPKKIKKSKEKSNERVIHSKLLINLLWWYT